LLIQALAAPNSLCHGKLTTALLIRTPGQSRLTRLAEQYRKPRCCA